MIELTWLEVAMYPITAYALGWCAGFVVLNIKRAFEKL